MILCHWNGQWFLSTGINQEKGICWLRCGKQMPRPHYFQPLPPIGAQWYGNTDDVAGITFYPNIYYHGLRVWLEGWAPNTPNPVLYCRIVPESEDVERSPYYNGPSLAQVNQARDRDRDEWARLLAQREKGWENLFQRLIEDGWARPGKDEFTRLVHIDELEKIEGPPPNGPF